MAFLKARGKALRFLVFVSTAIVALALVSVEHPLRSVHEQRHAALRWDRSFSETPLVCEQIHCGIENELRLSPVIEVAFHAALRRFQSSASILVNSLLAFGSRRYAAHSARAPPTPML